MTANRIGAFAVQKVDTVLAPASIRQTTVQEMSPTSTRSAAGDSWALLQGRRVIDRSGHVVDRSNSPPIAGHRTECPGVSPRRSASAPKRTLSVTMRHDAGMIDAIQPAALARLPPDPTLTRSGGWCALSWSGTRPATARLLTAAERDSLAAFISLLVYNGLRINEKRSAATSPRSRYQGGPVAHVLLALDRGVPPTNNAEDVRAVGFVRTAANWSGPPSVVSTAVCSGSFRTLDIVVAHNRWERPNVMFLSGFELVWGMQ